MGSIDISISTNTSSTITTTTIIIMDSMVMAHITVRGGITIDRSVKPGKRARGNGSRGQKRGIAGIEVTEESGESEENGRIEARGAKEGIDPRGCGITRHLVQMGSGNEVDMVDQRSTKIPVQLYLRERRMLGKEGTAGPVEELRGRAAINSIIAECITITRRP